jgi:hypothetical protein
VRGSCDAWGVGHKRKVVAFALQEGDHHDSEEVAEAKNMLEELSDNNAWGEERTKAEASTTTERADRKKAWWRRIRL